MSEHIVELNESPTITVDGWNVRCDDMFIQREEIVRCRDCSFAYRVVWPESCDVPPEFRNCQGPLVSLWDYEWDRPKMNPVEPDGFCKWGRRRK